MSLADRLQKIQLLLSDIDGVMTDGGLIFDNHGVETKRFHIRDGLGIRLWQRAGLKFGLVTGRVSEIVERRAAELDIEHLRTGSDDKLTGTKAIAAELDVALESVCYIGDDLPDLPAIGAVGFGVAVADAAEEVRAAADYVTKRRGGEGALRELIELVLRETNRWDEALKPYR